MAPALERLRKIAAWPLVAAYMAMIFYLSHKPAIEIPPLFQHQDKVFHFTEYLGLAVLLAFAFGIWPARRRFLLAFALASVYGVTDEIHQSYVPGRECSAWDWLADTAGGWAGAWLWPRVESLLTRARNP